MAKGKFAEWLEPDGLLRIEGWARDGLTDEQIAHNMGINVATLYRWKNDHSEICNVLKKTKDVADRIIENALFERAKGGAYPVKKVFKVKKEYFDEHGRKCFDEILETRTEEVYIPGDTTAQIFWLKNRKRDVWGDKAQITDEVKQDDGFIEALNGTAEQDWANEDTTEESSI